MKLTSGLPYSASHPSKFLKLIPFIFALLELDFPLKDSFIRLGEWDFMVLFFLLVWKFKTYLLLKTGVFYWTGSHSSYNLDRLWLDFFFDWRMKFVILLLFKTNSKELLFSSSSSGFLLSWKHFKNYFASNF